MNSTPRLERERRNQALDIIAKYLGGVGCVFMLAGILPYAATYVDRESNGPIYEQSEPPAPPIQSWEITCLAIGSAALATGGAVATRSYMVKRGLKATDDLLFETYLANDSSLVDLRDNFDHDVITRGLDHTQGQDES